MKTLISIVAIFLPMKIKIYIYRNYFKYKIGSNCSIGLSFILLDNLTMKDNAKISHLNVFKGFSLLSMGEHSSIGNLNWISGFPKNIKSEHFSTEKDRFPSLYLGNHSAITNRHLIDCTAMIKIGNFTTFAGFRSQILTHSINLSLSKQESSPVNIGDYCFLGTNSILLKGTSLPSYSVLGANSTLTKKHFQEFSFYAGNPALVVKELNTEMSYFHRKSGFII